MTHITHVDTDCCIIVYYFCCYLLALLVLLLMLLLVFVVSIVYAQTSSYFLRIKQSTARTTRTHYSQAMLETTNKNMPHGSSAIVEWESNIRKAGIIWNVWLWWVYTTNYRIIMHTRLLGAHFLGNY